MKWRNHAQGNGSTAVLTPRLVISAFWDNLRPRGAAGGPNYKASVFGQLLDYKFETLDEAKKEAEKLAREELNRALACLNGEHDV